MTVTTKVESSVSVKNGKNARKRWERTPKKQRSREMSSVAKSRWDAVTRNDEQLRECFQKAPLDDVLEIYAVMRKQYEMVGRILDDRVQQERNKEACANCGKEFSKDSPWYNREPVKDEATGIITNVFSCSQACMIALRGKQIKRGSR